VERILTEFSSIKKDVCYEEIKLSNKVVKG